MTLSITILGIIGILIGVVTTTIVVYNRVRKKKKAKSQLNKMDIYLVIIFITATIFTAIMISLFQTYGSVPDSLIMAVFGILGGECGAMAWIKSTKEKNKDRKWELQDREIFNNMNNDTFEQ